MKYLFLLIAALSATISYSQSDKPEFYNTGGNLYYEIFRKQASSDDSINITVQFRLSLNLLRFVKSGSINNFDSFTSSYNLEIEFRDADGIIRKRINLADTVNTSNYEDINRIDKFVYHSVNFNLLKGKYQPVIRIFDHDRTKLLEDKLKIPDNDQLNTDSKISSIVFAATNGNQILNQIILNGNAGFGSHELKLLLEIKDNNTSFQTYKIDYLDTSNRPVYVPDELEVKGNTEFRNNSKLVFKTNKFTGSQITIETTNENSGVLICVLPSDRNIPGKYLLTLTDETGNQVKYQFNVIWERMSPYLLNPSKAADIMYYILTDSEYEKIKKGSDKEIIKNIFEWWRTKDPTKFSIYNEAMIEYFDRAEFAQTRFKTNFEKEGARSDRGKIYILNGKPDNLVNEMQISGHNIEVWKYKKLNKQFIFETDNNGIIYLKDIKPY